MRLSESVYLVSGGYYGLLGNAYAIRGKHAVALIDCGQAVAAEHIQSVLAYWGMDSLPITHLFLTHTHHDHAGSAKYFQDKGAKVFCSELDAPTLVKGGFLADETPYGEEWEYPACMPDALLHDKDVLQFEDFKLHFYAAPGHSDGSFLIQLQDGDLDILFSGDVFSCDGERGEDVIIGWKGCMDYSPTKYQKTLDMAYKTFHPDFVLGGHGIPCVKDGSRVIRNAYRKFLLQYR